MKNRKHAAFIIGGTNSSAGKTTVALGVMEALKRRGISVQPFKAGPDYIDPGHHRALLKRPSYNLDTWMMGKDGVRRTFREKSAKAQVSVIEGVMGLFDGKDGVSDEGSTAHISKLLGIPVLLVVNAEKTARSVGAMVKGFDAFDPKVRIRWVVFNKTASPSHYGILKDSVEKNCRAKVLGYIPKDEKMAMPERHLGLITSGDLKSVKWDAFIRRAGDAVEEHVDIEGLLADLPERPEAKKTGYETRPKRPLVKIAVALDKAFCFYYEENLEILKKLGSELVFFSPLRDKKLPEGADGIYIGGGYPELYGRELARNIQLRGEIKRLAARGLPIYAECGGLMYLGRSIGGKNGGSFKGAGVFPWRARMLPKRKALGYREVIVNGQAPFECSGPVRGHEFHYSEISEPPSGIKRCFKVRRASGEVEYDEGYLYKNTIASYAHLHFASNPGFAAGFVEMCKKLKRSDK